MNKFEFYNFTIKTLSELIDKHQLNINMFYPTVQDEENILFFNEHIGLKFTRFLRASFVNVSCFKIQSDKNPLGYNTKLVNLFWLVNQIEHKYDVPPQKTLAEEENWHKPQQKVEIQEHIQDIYKIENQLFDKSYRLFDLAFIESNKYYNSDNAIKLPDEKKHLVDKIMRLYR